nr:uncharacterized protein LOC109150699 isoform X6 [Ipomoea batatas]
MVKDVPKHTYDAIDFYVVVEAAEKLLRMSRDDPPGPDQLCMQHDEAFWANPTTITTVEDIENATIIKQEQTDMPCFSLGLTQSPVARPYAGKDHTGARNGGCPFGVIDRVEPDVATDEHPELGENEARESMAPIGAQNGKSTSGFVIPPPQSCARTSLRGFAKLAPCRVPLKVVQPQLIASSPVGGNELQNPRPIKSIMTLSQFALWHWFFNHSNRDNNKVIFAFNKRVALVADFESLQLESAVRVAIIDCWCCVLNEKEKYKRRESPSQFFVSMHTIVSATASRERRLKWFMKWLDGNFDIAPHINRGTVDLFFFPISHAQHYFVLCVDTRGRRLEIIDNTSEFGTTNDRYGRTPEDLKDLLSTYLEKKGQLVRAATVRNLKPTRMRMGWLDSKNKVDCAMYAMRHMETFMGQPCKQWHCGLETRTGPLLQGLRRKYLRDILMADINMHKEWIMERTSEYDYRNMGRSTRS